MARILKKNLGLGINGDVSKLGFGASSAYGVIFENNLSLRVNR